MKLFLISILKKIPWLYFLIYSTRYKREINSASRLIIVTTPGHVGSSTTFKSLLSIDWDVSTRIYDIHSLRERFNNKSSISSISARHVLQEVIRRMMISGKLKNKSINIVTLVRDPLARALGGKFQNPKAFIRGEYDAYKTLKECADGCEKIKRQILDSGYLKDTIHWQMSFYEEELKSFWGFDLSKPDLIVENGFIFSQYKNHRIFIFALEYLDKKMQEKIKFYFEEDIELVYANTHAQRKYNNTYFYNYCKQNMKFSTDLVNNIFDHSFLRKIYPIGKLEEFRNFWLE